jgi:ribonuclease-3
LRSRGVSYDRRASDSEGDLSRARAALVKQPTLASIGQRLGLDSQIILGAGELRSGGAQRGAVLADAVEGLIGAVLLDGGAEAAEALIDLLFAQEFATLPDAEELKDAKTRLQEWLQGKGYRLPSYAVDTVRGGITSKRSSSAAPLKREMRIPPVKDRAAATPSRKRPRRCFRC